VSRSIANANIDLRYAHRGRITRAWPALVEQKGRGTSIGWPRRFGSVWLAAVVLFTFTPSVLFGEQTRIEHTSTDPFYPLSLGTIDCSYGVDGVDADVLTDMRARAQRSDARAAFWLAQYYVVCEAWSLEDEPQLLQDVVNWYALALRAEPGLITYEALGLLSDHFGALSRLEDRDALAEAIWKAGVERELYSVDDFLEAAVCARVPGALDELQSLAISNHPSAEFAQLALGDMFDTGRCVSPNRYKAIIHFQQCVGVIGNICDLRLVSLYEEQAFSVEEEAFYLRPDIPDRDDWLAQAVRRGSAAALPLLEREALSGNEFAAIELGRLYSGRDAIDDKPKEAALWFESCAATSWVCADFLLEVIAEEGFSQANPDDFPRMAFGVVEQGLALNYPPGVTDVFLANEALEIAPTAANRLKAADIFYGEAAGSWVLSGPERLDLVQRALDIDPRPSRWSQAAHVLYAIAHIDEEARDSVLDQSLDYFRRAGQDIDALGLARRALMQVLANQHYTRGGEVDDTLGRSAKLGSTAAQNTLDWLTSVEERNFPERDRGTSVVETDLCSEKGDNLNGVLRQHFRQAQELMETRGGPRPVTAADVASLLESIRREGAETALLIYAEGWDGHCVWLLDGEGVRAFEKLYAPPGSIDADLRRLYDALGVPEDPNDRAAMRASGGIRTGIPGFFGPSREEQVNIAVRSLSHVLLPGRIADEILQYRSVFIAPFGGVGSAPFNILQTSSGAYVSDQVNFIILAGFSELPRHLGWAGTPRVPTAGITSRPSPVDGVDANPAIVVLGNPRSAGSLGEEFVDLPGAEAEAEEVAELFGATPYLREMATTEVLVSQGRRARILYFAGHGVAAAETPEAALDESYLVTADGRWTARQIQSEVFTAEIAVLSACQTGLGFEHAGGTIGLSRAFIIAGVPKVVMSLWSVDDEATAFLMTEFMRRSRELPYVDALREAIQAARQEYKDPALWGGFTLFTASID